MSAAAFRRRRAILALAVAAWAGAFLATHVPQTRMPTGIPVTDKTLHLFGYAGLTLFVWLAFRAYGHPLARRVTIVACLLAIYGVFDEATQPLLVNRHASAADWLWNCLGIALGLTLCESADRLRTALRK